MEAMRPPRASREAGYEYRDVILGGSVRISAQIAEMARSGWELIDIQAPHYGSLTVVGRFKRAIPPPAVVEREP